MAYLAVAYLVVPYLAYLAVPYLAVPYLAVEKPVLQSLLGETQEALEALEVS